MSLFWKVFWTVVIAFTGVVAQAAVADLWSDIGTLFTAPTLENLIAFLLAILVVIPTWFAWKGTKLIPYLTNFIVRIILMIIGVFVAPIMLVVFALIGIWLKS